MMNSPAQIDAELYSFVKQDRIRLMAERNEFKRLAEEREIELSEIETRSSQVISFLLILCAVLVGVLTYVLSQS